MKKLISILITYIIISCITILPVSAKQMDMYINNRLVNRTLETIGKFDMLPILDIAGELGYKISKDNDKITLYNDSKAFTFQIGKASVFDKNGKWYGLDVVPQYINGKLMIPYNFIINVLGMTYTWDSVTDTLFINSDSTYKWLINTAEYKQGKTKKAIQGWWFYYCSDYLMSHHSINICFNPDGTFFIQTWRLKGYGTYEVTDQDTISVTYDEYVKFAGMGTHEYYYSTTETYNFDGYNISDEYNTFTHKDSFTPVEGQI